MGSRRCLPQPEQSSPVTEPQSLFPSSLGDTLVCFVVSLLTLPMSLHFIMPVSQMQSDRSLGLEVSLSPSDGS